MASSLVAVECEMGEDDQAWNGHLEDIVHIAGRQKRRAEVTEYHMSWPMAPDAMALGHPSLDKSLGMGTHPLHKSHGGPVRIQLV